MLSSKIGSLDKVAFLDGLPFDLSVKIEQAGIENLDEMVEYSRRYLNVQRNYGDIALAAMHTGCKSSGERGGINTDHVTVYKKPQVFKERRFTQAEENRL